MNKYFKVNWRAIYKAMATPEGRGEIRTELKKISKAVDEKLSAKWKEEEVQKEANRVRAIKEMPQGSFLWYTGTDRRLLGKQGSKVRDGRTRVVIDFGEHGRWNCLYTQVTSTEPNKADMQVKKSLLNILTNTHD